MNRKLYPAIGGVIVALCAALTVGIAGAASGRTVGAAGSASGPTVAVRVEGISHTLLPVKTVTTHSGWITRFRAPRGKCGDTSGAGALDIATHHGWSGPWDGKLGDYEVFSILGETHTFSSKDYWAVFVNNVPDAMGICGTKLHSGEQILFAAVPDSGIAYPLTVSAPAHATVGHAFTVKVSWVKGTGATKPLAGASVNGKLTGGSGKVQITPTSAGTLTLHVAKRGYIRDEVTVRVS